MKQNGYNIISMVLTEDDKVEPDKIDPINLSNAVVDKIVEITKENPRQKLGKWGVHNTARAVRHFLRKKIHEREKRKEEREKRKLNKIKRKSS